MVCGWPIYIQYATTHMHAQERLSTVMLMIIEMLITHSKIGSLTALSYKCYNPLIKIFIHVRIENPISVSECCFIQLLFSFVRYPIIISANDYVHKYYAGEKRTNRIRLYSKVLYSLSIDWLHTPIRTETNNKESHDQSIPHIIIISIQTTSHFDNLHLVNQM